MNNKYDAFVSYASEDIEFVKPLAEKLKSKDINVWFDKFCIKTGDNNMQQIDEGLGSSNYGIVVASHHYFRKNWTMAELNALFTREQEGKNVILPIWHNISKEEVSKYSPLLAGKSAIVYAIEGMNNIDDIIFKLIEVINPNSKYLKEYAKDMVFEEYPEFDIRIKGLQNRQVFGKTPYDPNKSYLVIEVSNWGTRQVIISKAGFSMKTKTPKYGIAADSMIFGPKPLGDGDNAQYLVEQDDIDIGDVDYVWATDKVGRKWKGQLVRE